MDDFNSITNFEMIPYRLKHEIVFFKKKFYVMIMCLLGFQASYMKSMNWVFMMQFKLSVNDGGIFSPKYEYVMMKDILTSHKIKELFYDYVLWL